MSADQKVFQFTFISGKNQEKVLDKTSDGWYICNLGAFNAFDSRGQYYTVDDVHDLFFGPDSVLRRKLNKGLLSGEMGHPVCVPGMSKTDFYMRTLRIDENRVSHHIRNIQFKELPFKDSYNGKQGLGNMIQVVGEVYPAGPNGQYLKEVLENKGINVAFSIRSLTNDSMQGGLYVKKLTNCITYDWVTEPGINSATKFHTQSNESFSYSVADIEEIVNKGKALASTSFEAADDIETANKILKSINQSNKYQSLNDWYK